MQSAIANKFADILTDLARLMADNQGQSTHAMNLRDEMADLEAGFDDSEIEFLHNLSSDLYMVEDDEIFDKPDPELTDQHQLVSELKSAYENEDWLKVLRILRQQTAVPNNEYRAYLRGRAYESLGYLQPAAEFFRYASKLNPDDAAYRYSHLELLTSVDPIEAINQSQLLLDATHISPALLILAAKIQFAQTKDQEPAEQASFRTSKPLEIWRDIAA